MPRGKNYVNNDKGVTLQSHRRSMSMEPCFYGAACTRKDCIYRHDLDVPDAKKTNELCLAFLAGTCAFGNGTCKKRHPPKQEADRLRVRYSRIKCRYGDECKTHSCLYSHPRDQNEDTDAVSFLEQSAFPPLSAADGKKPAALPGSAWRAAPVVTPPDFCPVAPSPPNESNHATTPINAGAPAWFPGNPQEEWASQAYHEPPLNGENGQFMYAPMSEAPPPPMPSPEIPTPNTAKKLLNVNAKTWVPH